MVAKKRIENVHGQYYIKKDHTCTHTVNTEKDTFGDVGCYMKSVIKDCSYYIQYFFYIIRCGTVVFGVPSGRWTAPSAVSQWLFLEVCLLGNSLLARCFPFLLCEEGHALYFVLPVRNWLFNGFSKSNPM